MDDRWDLKAGDEWEGTVERGQSRLSAAARLAMALLLVVGIGIGFAVARISGDGGSSAADARSSDDPQTSTQSETVEEAPVPTIATGVTPTTTARGQGTATQKVDVIIGPPLDILSRTAIGEMWPVGIVTSADGFILYGADAHNYLPGDSTGVEAWTSPNGQTWTSIGTVLPAPATIHNVYATAQGYMAPGSLGAAMPVLFRSEDGITWSTHDLPGDGTEFPIGVAATDSAIVVVAGFGGLRQDPIHDALPEQFRPSETNGLHLSWGGPPFSVQVQAPMGITIYTATADDLGLDDDLVDMWMGGGPEMGGTTIWHSTDGTDWTSSTIDDLMLNSVAVDSSGNFVASGYGFSGEQSLKSADGITWEEVQRPRNIQQTVSGDVGSIGMSYGNRASLVVSLDGETWTTINPQDVLGDELDWHFNPLAAGSSGFAAVATGYDSSEMMFGPEPVEVEKDGVLLESNLMQGSLRITRDDVELFRLSLHSGRTSDQVDVDINGQAITFLDDDGAAIVTFTFEELQTAERQMHEDMGRSNPQSAVMYSADGTTWSLAQLPSAGFRDHVSHILLGNDQLLTVSAKQDASLSGTPSTPEVSVLRVALP